MSLKVRQMIFTIFAVGLMISIDSSGLFSYFSRSLLKIIFFGLVPLLWLKKTNQPNFNLKKDKNLKRIIILMVIIILVVLLGAYGLYMLGYLDNVKASVGTQVGVNANNYPLVFLYIVVVNGPLEEFFFRHFVNTQDVKYSVLVSSFLFSMYHVGMLYTMFNWVLFLAAIIGLMVVGLFFTFINQTKNSILNSILIHMAANLAINLVGWFLIM